MLYSALHNNIHFTHAYLKGRVFMGYHTINLLTFLSTQWPCCQIKRFTSWGGEHAQLDLTRWTYCSDNQ